MTPLTQLPFIDRNGLFSKAYRFANRQFILAKIHLLGEDMHIIQDHDKKLAYLPIPKVACSSVKYAFLKLASEEITASLKARELRHAHQFFSRRPSAWMSQEKFSSLDSFRFTIVRDPIERFLSAYVNRVLQFKDLELPGCAKRLREKKLTATPDVNTFALNLREYANINPSIKHHVKQQVAFIKQRRFFDAIYKFDDLEFMVKDIEQRTGVRLSLTQANPSTITKPQLQPEAIAMLNEYFRDDYRMLPDVLTPIETSICQSAQLQTQAHRAAG